MNTAPKPTLYTDFMKYWTDFIETSGIQRGLTHIHNYYVGLIDQHQDENTALQAEVERLKAEANKAIENARGFKELMDRAISGWEKSKTICGALTELVRKSEFYVGIAVTDIATSLPESRELHDEIKAVLSRAEGKDK